MDTRNSAFQHFSGTGAGDVNFTRSVQSIMLTTSANATVSFDGGTNFWPITNGTYQFNHIHVKLLKFGTGTWAGVGVAL